MGYTARSIVQDPRGVSWQVGFVPAYGDFESLLKAFIEALGRVAPPTLEDLHAGLQPQGAVMTGLGPEDWVLRWGDHVARASWLAPRGRWGVSRAAEVRMIAHRLRGFGLDAPRPYGVVERKWRAAAHPSVYLSEHIEAPDIVSWWHRVLLASRPQGLQAFMQRKREFLHEVGRAWGVMSREGVVLERFDPASFVVTETGLRIDRVADLARLKPSRQTLAQTLSLMAQQRGRFIGFSRTDDLRVLHGFFRNQAQARVQVRYWLRRLGEASD